MGISWSPEILSQMQTFCLDEVEISLKQSCTAMGEVSFLNVILHVFVIIQTTLDPTVVLCCFAPSHLLSSKTPKTITFSPAVPPLPSSHGKKGGKNTDRTDLEQA